MTKFFKKLKKILFFSHFSEHELLIVDQSPYDMNFFDTHRLRKYPIVRPISVELILPLETNDYGFQMIRSFHFDL